MKPTIYSLEDIRAFLHKRTRSEYRDIGEATGVSPVTLRHIGFGYMANPTHHTMSRVSAYMAENMGGGDA